MSGILVPFNDFSYMQKLIKQDVMTAFARVYDKQWYINGIEKENFEKNYADFCGTKYCIGVGNGLDAHGACSGSCNLPAALSLSMAALRLSRRPSRHSKKA